jgi:hypothetical protein
VFLLLVFVFLLRYVYRLFCPLAFLPLLIWLHFIFAFALVFVQYYDATAVRLIRAPSPRAGSSQGGTESDMSFANFAVLSDLEMALNPAAIFGFQCMTSEEFGRVTYVIQSTMELLRVIIMIPPSHHLGMTTCYFFRKDAPHQRAAVEFEYEDTSLPTLNSITPAEALVSGGDVLRLDIARFPTNIIGIADVLVLVGGVEADILQMQNTATLSSTVFFVTVPEGRPLGGRASRRAERCSVSLRGAAATMRVDFELTYVAPPPPEITYTSKARISAFGGESIIIHVKGLILVTVTGEGSYTSRDVSVLFGVVEGEVSVVSWTKASTVLHVRVPVLSSSGDVELRVFANRHGSENAAITGVFAFRDEPLLNLYFPDRGEASGRTMTVVLGNVRESYAIADFTAMVMQCEGEGDDATVSVQAASQGKDGTYSVLLLITAPPQSEVRRRRIQSAITESFSNPSTLTIADMRITVSLFIKGLETPISFPWMFLDDSQPYIFSVYPPDGPTTGYRVVTLDVRHWPGLERVFAEDGEGISVTFGGREALKIRKVTEEVMENGHIQTLISVLAPSFPVFGTVDIMLSLQAGAEDAPIVQSEFTFYSTCDYDVFCKDQYGDYVVNTGVLESSPPADALCSLAYCIKPPPPPFLRDVSTYSVFDVGGDVVVVTLAEWPQSELSLVSIKLVVDQATFIIAASSVEVRGEKDTAITFTTPVLKAGTGSLVVVDIESGVSLAVQNLQVFAYPQGKPAVFALPTFGISEETTPVFVELSNCPPSEKANVRIRFGNIVLQPLSFTSTRQQTSTIIAVPSRICSEDCSTLVEMSVVDRFGMPRTAHFVFTHRVPEPTIKSYYPVEGASTQPVRVTVVVESMKVLENGHARYVNSESDVSISWAGERIAPIDGSGVVSGRSFSFAFLTPVVQSISQAEDVLVSVISTDGSISTTAGGGGSHNNGTFIYTYVPAAPRLISVIPSRIPTTQPPITRVKFSGQFFSANGVCATICGVRVTPECSYSPSVELLVCGFTMPECNKLGHGILVVDADDLNEALEIAVELVRPPLQVLISREDTAVPTISHTAYKKVAATLPTPIILYAWWSGELDFPQVVQGVSCSDVAFGGWSMERLEASEADMVGLDTQYWWKIKSKSPNFSEDSATGLVDCKVSLSPGEDVYEFRLDLFQPPAIRYVEPSSVYTSGGQELTISMKNFPAITRADEVTLKINSSAQLVRSVAGNSAAFLVTMIVPPMEVGVFEVSISSSRYSYLGDIKFDLVFEARPPAIQSVRPSVGSMEGSSIVDVKIVYMTPIEDADDVSVGSEDLAWQLHEIVYSDSSGTYIRVVAPPSAKAGKIEVLVTQKLTQETVYFQYQYIDNSFTVLTPGAECFDGGGDAEWKLAELGHCITRGALESPMRTIDLVVKGFPPVRNTADIGILFGLHSEPGVINRVSYNLEEKSLTVQVVPPQYSADVGWDNAGWIISESWLLLLSDPTVCALFYTVYLRPLAVASAAFKAQYSFVDLTFNQPTNGGNAGSRIVCSRLIDETDLELMGHFPPGVSDDCIWQSASVLRILYKPLPSQEKVLAPGDPLHVLGGQLHDDGNHRVEVRLADQIVTVLSDIYAAAPEASLIGVTSLGFCEPLALDASGSKGTRLSYQWRCLNDDGLNELLKTASGPKIEVPPSLLSKTDFSFQIAVSVTDFADITSSQRIATVYRSSSPLPTILINSDAEIFVESGIGVSLSGKAEFSSCSEASQMEFKWFGGQDGGDLAELGTKAIAGVSGEVSDQYEIGGRTMYIYPQALTPGQSYTFELVGAPMGEPWNTVSASVVVHVLLPALVVDIVGGVSREVSNLKKDIVIDGSKSHDPSGIFQFLKYDWFCVSRATNDVCRHQTTHQVGDGAPHTRY